MTSHGDAPSPETLRPNDAGNEPQDDGSAKSTEKPSVIERGDMEMSGSEGTESPVIDDGSSQQLPTWRFFTIILCLCVGLFLTLMDMSIISTALYTISVEFDNYDHTIWAALSYILADIGCGVFFTRLADVYGRKMMIMASFFFFTCFSLACGFAQNVEQLILFRTLQGVGGTGLYSLTMVICPEISPPKYLPFVVGSLGAAVAVAGVCGPVLGGVITGTTTWRWIFWLNVPIGCVAMVVLYFAWPTLKNITQTKAPATIKQIDYLGALLMAVGSVCFVFTLQEVGSRKYTWDSAINVSLLVLSCVAWVALFAWEWFISHSDRLSWILPELPWRILTHRPMVMAILTTLMAGYVQFSAVFSIPLRAQLVDLQTPVQAGIRLLPLVSATAVGSLIGGGASAKKNLTFYTMSIATALMMVGTGLLSTMPSDGSQTNAHYGWEVILGLGLGMSVSTATFMTSMEVEFVDHAVAQGTVAQARILGGSFGLVASTIIMNNHMETSLKGAVTDEVLGKLFISPFSILDYGAIPALLFRESYISAFAQDMKLALYMSVVGFVTSLCIWQRHPPTVQERSDLLAKAVKEHRDEVRMAETGLHDVELREREL
ncbi:MFS general substrate transporter [Venustampulla echinocandica]|uniref:MFS general substrate transporter n=1 Tax=Venustampulla echinocandica TaxID=2656787 RepID=A0A370TEW7_9HELO|nr:MFS general substrate transporter [Venustampulla echinocandica]RDL33234.1 MFS general substrate transporter [Venustampulla echinocandica]